jgi:hypothetical protein
VDDPEFKFEDFLAAHQMLGGTGIQLGEFASQNAEVVKQLESFEPFETAMTFGGLLTVADLQSNCIRLEVLTHLALACGNGSRKPFNRLFGKVFTALEQSVCGRLEDPAEDVFVTSVSTPRGNFRVLEGTWESAGFFLQRMVNVVEGMPSGRNFDDVRESVYSLLGLSDLLCERAELTRYQLGNPIPEESLPKKITKTLRYLRQIVRFSRAELDDVGISIDHISKFVFDPDERQQLYNDNIGHSSLERHPVIWCNEELLFLLPTATSVAIRRFVIEFMDAAGLRETFLVALAREYTDLFSLTPLLGGRFGAPVEFKRTENGLLAGTGMKVDRGRYLNFVFFVDTLEEFERTGFLGSNPDPLMLADDVDHWIDHAYEAARNEDQFLNGLTLLVGCGVGRGVVNYLNNKDRPCWRIDFLSAPDLLTLSWTPDFEPISLWRILDARERIGSLGVELFNINGLLNMVAWSRSLGGHLVPHGQLPDDFVSESGSSFVMIEQNSLRNLRHEVAVAGDLHVEQDVRGCWTGVRKEDHSLFEEDRQRPFYVSERRPDEGSLLGVYLTDQRSWWCDIEVADSKEFSTMVADRLKELGWQAESEIAITKLLAQGFERDYGDVDVLAWIPMTGRVLIIECKDVQYRKTYGEISEQLSDFRGELREDGKPDYLLRHLNRVDIVSSHLSLVAKYVKMKDALKVESYLVFRNPVPMQFALKKMSEQVSVSTFDQLGEI